MKKILTVALCVLVICLLAMPVSAAEANVVISPSATTLYRGDTFTVTAVLNNTEAIGVGSVTLLYPDNIFEMTGGTCHIAGVILGQVETSKKGGAFAFNTGETAVVSGKIFTFQLRVKEDAQFGAYSINSTATVGISTGGNVQSSGTRITVACRHDYQNCTKVDDGNHQSTCKTCGDVLKQSHNWVDTEVLKAADCKETGSKKQECVDCHAQRTTDIPLTDTHAFGAWEKKPDGATHARVCSVCQREESQNHTWNAGKVTKKATCKETGTRVRTCTACGAQKTETIAKTGHTYPSYTEVNGNVHKAVCADCGKEHTEAHKFGKDWAGDSKDHYKRCSDCGYIADRQAHTPDTAGEVCTVCGRNLLSDHIHSFVEQWIGDSTGHWHFCTECLERSDFEAHVYDDACDAKCDLCGTKREPQHQPKEDFESDKTGHWHICADCGEKTGFAEHIPGDKATNSKPQTCTECGFVIAPVLAHEHYPNSVHTHSCECGESYVADANTCEVCREANRQFPWWIICILEALVIAGAGAYWFLQIRQRPAPDNDEEEVLW